MYNLIVGSDKIISTYIDEDRVFEKPKGAIHSLIINVDVPDCACKFTIGNQVVQPTHKTSNQFVLLCMEPMTIKYSVSKYRYITASSTIEFTNTQDQVYNIVMEPATQIIYNKLGEVFYPQALEELQANQFASSSDKNASISGKLDFLNVEAIETNSLSNALTNNRGITSVSFPAAKIIKSYGLQRFAPSCTTITRLDFPEVVEVEERGCNAFLENYNAGGPTVTVNFPKLKRVGANGFAQAFAGNGGGGSSAKRSKVNVTFPELEYVSTWGFYDAFIGCSNITSMTFPKLKTIENLGFASTFSLGWDLTTLYFPALETVGVNAFSGIVLGTTSIRNMYFPRALAGHPEITKEKMWSSDVAPFNINFTL